MKTIKKICTFFFAILILYSCSGGICKDDVYAIEDALQSFWEITNLESPVGALDCNIFNTKASKDDSGTYKATYTLRSTWSNGEKTFVEMTGASLAKNPDGSFKVLDAGYNK